MVQFRHCWPMMAPCRFVAVLAVLVSVCPVEATAVRLRRERPPRFDAPVPEPRPEMPAAPVETPAPQAAPEASPQQTAPADSGAVCRQSLAALGVTFQPAAVPAGSDARCTVDVAVRLDHMTVGNATIRWPDRPLVSCGLALRLAGFTRDVVRPMAAGIAGAELTAFGTGNGFECRPRNRQAGAKLSAHGQGLAVDIGWFEFQGRGRIGVAAPGSEQNSRFVDAVRKAACGWFTTTLGPGSDPAHGDHLHFDAEPRGRDGQSRFCQ